MIRSRDRSGSRIGIAVGLVLAAFAALVGQAHAGDRAQVEVIGFSPDGRYVAYEEFGIQDGSGYPFSVIFIVDLAENAPAIEAPITAFVEDDEVVLAPTPVATAAVRALAQEQAARALAELGIVPGETGEILVLRPYSDLSAPQLEIRFSIGALYSPYVREENLLRLTLTQTHTEVCDSVAPGPVYLLRADLVQPGELVTTLRDEDALPRDYFCPTEYRIHSIVVYAPREPAYVDCCADRYGMLVLVAAQQFPGFEGPDYRFYGFGAMIDLLEH